MVRNSLLAQITTTDKSLEASDVYTYAFRGVDALLFLKDGKLGAMVKGGEVKEDIFSLDLGNKVFADEKLIQILDLQPSELDEPDTYFLSLRSNLNSTASFKFSATSLLNENYPLSFALIEAKLTGRLVSPSFSARTRFWDNKAYEGKSEISVSGDSFRLLGKQEGKNKEATITRRALSGLFFREVKSLRRHFSNSANYAIIGWGGVGNVKGKLTSKQERQQSVEDIYRVVGSFPGGAGFGLRASYISKKGLSKSAELTDKSVSGDGAHTLKFRADNPVIVNSVLNADAVFNMLFNEGITYLFLPASVSAEVKDGFISFDGIDDLIASDGQSIVLSGGIR